MSEYVSQRKLSDTYIPALQEILAPLLIQPAPFLEDVNHATDLMVLLARDVRIAARVRTYGVKASYDPDEFTIRSALPSGANTEIDKIREGFGDWMIYAHAAKEPGRIESWMVIDLDVFRKFAVCLDRNPNGTTKGNPHYIRYEEKGNWKGDKNKFYVFWANSFPADPPLLIASSN